jgi:hypothetical protein
MIKLLVDKALADEQSKRGERESSFKFSPSSFGYCFRRQYYKKLGEKETNPPDERTLRVFACGHRFHEWIQSLLPEGVQTEVLIEDENIKGYADVVTDTAVIDIKTTHSYAFKYVDDENILEEKKHNWLQVGWYAMKLGKAFASLCMVSKDDLRIAEYTLNMDKIKPLVEEEVKTLLSFKSLPPPEPRLFGIIEKGDGKGEPKECFSYCPFRTLCKGAGYGK